MIIIVRGVIKGKKPKDEGKEGRGMWNTGDSHFKGMENKGTRRCG